MNIWITTSGLGDNSSKPGFRQRTLWFLLELKRLGHRFSTDSSMLDESQMSLLNQEGLGVAEFEKTKADIIIDAHNNGLSVIDHDLEILNESNDWDGILRYITGKRRVAERTRKTRETDIYVKVDIDGAGENKIETGIPFFDHMLEQIARHGFVDLEIYCKGDLHIDEHHTIEDVGIALGECLAEAIGDKRGIERYGFVLPMDEALATVAMDLSGRPYLVFEGAFTREKVGDFPTEMTKHFFYSLAMGLKATLNIKFQGENDHHNIEAIFKGFARTLKQAVSGNPKAPDEIPSSKGSL